MARIAFLSPVPPARTGVATYASDVLRDLATTGFTKRHRLHVPRPNESLDAAVARSDLAVYHLGNNHRYHGEIYRLAVRRPGLVVLHDLALDDLVRGLIDARDPPGYRTEAEAIAARRALGTFVPEGPLDTPWCALAVRRARGVVVHAPFGRRYLEAFGCRTPIHVVPHPVPPPVSARVRRRARRISARHPGRVIIGVLGDIGRAKCIDSVLDAAGLMGDNVHVAVVGRRIPGYDVGAAIKNRRMTGRVTVVHNVRDVDFMAWIVASDVIVNLRHPHRGEVSGTVVKGMRVGKPVLVSSVGSYLDWPEGTVVRAPAGHPDPSVLAETLDPLVRNPGLRAAIGRSARDLIDRQDRNNATARDYGSAVEQTLRLLRDPGQATVERWAAAWADLGAVSAGARRLSGDYLEALDEIVSAPTT
jgi:glycosyltransferase involved in cell wall biosynthesis